MLIALAEAGTTLADRVMDLLTLKGWSGYRLAKETGLSPAYVQKLVGGMTKRPSYETVERLAKALGVSAEYLRVGTNGLTAPPDISVLPDPIQWLIRHIGKDLDADDLRAILEYAEGRIALKRSRDGAFGYQAPEVHRAAEEPPQDKSA